MIKLTAAVKEYPMAVPVALLAVLAFTLRYWFFWNYPYPLMLHEQDGIAYMSIARDILAGKVPANLFMPPFYPLVIVIFSFLPVKLEIAARVAAITMDALTILPIYGLSRIILPRAASLAACFLWATFGFSLYYSASPLSQSTYLCMLLSGTYLLHLALQNSARRYHFVLSGLLLSAAYQTRPEGVVTLGAGVFLIVFFGIRNSADRSRYLQGAAFFAMAFLLASLPYLLMLRNQIGFWTFTGKTTVAIKGIDGSLTITSGSGPVKTGIVLWLEQFGGISGGLNFIWGNINGFWGTLKSAFPAWVTYTALIGIPVIVVSRNLLQRLIFIAPVAALCPVFVANLPKAHAYIYPAFPLFLLAFTAALWFFASSAAGLLKLLPIPNGIAPMAGYLLLFAPLPFIAVNNFTQTNASFTDPEMMYQVNMANSLMKPAADDLKRYSGERDLVMTRWGLISYYAERPLMNMPKGSIDQVVAAGRDGGAKFMIIDTQSVETRRQELAPLLAPLYGSSVDSRLPIETVSTGNSQYGGYVLYRFR